MSAYKKLNKQDAFITTYTAHKQWAITGSDFSSYGITWNGAVTGENLNSLQQLYYPNKISGSITSHSFDYYNQTTLYQSQSRNLQTGSFLLNVPRNLYGTAMKPQDGFELSIQDISYLSFLLVELDYVVDGYVQPYQTNSGRPAPLAAVVTVTTLQDDGEGRIYISGSSPRTYVGDIIYPHGMVILTDPGYSAVFENAMSGRLGGKNVRFNFKSSQPVFTHNYHCKVRESEFNYTYNPSTTSGSIATVYNNEGDIYSQSAKVSDGVLLPNITGSEFQPYITTVGLYNDANELIAVGKLNRPVPKSSNTEMTIIVKIDI